MQKILLLEDDLNLNRGIALLLSREGYEAVSYTHLTLPTKLEV